MNKATLKKIAMVAGVILSMTGCENDHDLYHSAQVRVIQPIDLAAEVKTPPPSTMPVTQPMKELDLSIEQVRQAALANNLDLQVDLLDPTIAKQSVNEEEAKFEALFTTDVQYSMAKQPAYTQLQSTQTRNLAIQPGISVPLRTGGTLSLSLPINRFETNNQFNTINGPVYTTDPAISLSQPLLRGAGRDVAEYSIRLAKLQYRQTEAATKLEVIRVIADADRDYWNLYAARQQVEVAKEDYQLALVQLKRARRMVDAGQSAQVEIVRAESGAADKFEAIIDADNAAVTVQRDLKRIMNRPDLPMNGPTILVPTTLPGSLYYRVDPEKLAAQAVQDRMEMLETELQIAQETLTVNFEHNDMLPLVALQYTYDVSGLGSDWHDAFSQARHTYFQGHTLGLHVEVPIGNAAARARLRRALATRQQQLATRQQRIAQIRQDVFVASAELETNWQKTLAARERVRLAQRLLEAEVRQFQQGLQTSTDVLQAQTSLASAKSDEITAVANYQIAQVDIAFATGTVLGASRIQWNPAAIAPE